MFDRRWRPHHPAPETCYQVYQLLPSGYERHEHRHRSACLVKIKYLIVSKFGGPFLAIFATSKYPKFKEPRKKFKLLSIYLMKTRNFIPIFLMLSVCRTQLHLHRCPAFGGRLTLFCLVSRSPALVHKSPAFYVHYKY